MRHISLTVFATLSALGMSACSPSKPTTDDLAAAATAEAPAPEKPTVIGGPVVHAGGGLQGLTSIKPEMLLDTDSMVQLMSVVFSKQGTAQIIVDDGENNYDAKPLAAIRFGNEIIFLVNNTNTNDCHNCSGATSVYYMSSDGSVVKAAYPFTFSGNGWGGSSRLEAILLPNGGLGILLSSGFTAQGYTCGSYDLVQVAPGRPHRLTNFPDGYDDSGNFGPSTTLSLVGMEWVSNEKLRLHWDGSRKSENGEFTPLMEDREVSLDGSEPGWIANWQYEC